MPACWSRRWSGWSPTATSTPAPRETVDEHGHVTGPVSDELPIRAFWARWRELMDSTTEAAR